MSDVILRLHATCIALADKGVLLVGDSGIGKSDLALRLIDAGAMLVADDQVELALRDGHLVAAAPAAIVGLMEVRHIGLLRLPYLPQVPLMLQVNLVSMSEKLERLPKAQPIFYLDQPLRCLRLPAMAASTPAKIRAALLYPDITDSHEV